MVFLISWLLQSWRKLKHHYFFFCVGIMYSGEYDHCDVTLIVYPHLASLKTVARHIFQACPVWIYTQSNITNIKYYCWHTLVWRLCLPPTMLALTCISQSFHLTNDYKLSALNRGRREVKHFAHIYWPMMIFLFLCTLFTILFARIVALYELVVYM